MAIMYVQQSTSVHSRTALFVCFSYTSLYVHCMLLFYMCVEYRSSVVTCFQLNVFLMSMQKMVCMECILYFKWNPFLDTTTYHLLLRENQHTIPNSFVYMVQTLACSALQKYLDLNMGSVQWLSCGAHVSCLNVTCLIQRGNELLIALVTIRK